MNPEPEFSVLNRNDTEALTSYSNRQTTETSVPSDFFTTEPHASRRKLAVTEIAGFAKPKDDPDPDQYIPYLAMTYFDCYYFIAQLKEVTYADCNDAAKVRLIALSCFTISSKMRKDSFCVAKFLESINAKIMPGRILALELRILNLLYWQMRPVTPFSFLDYYCSHFKQYGGYSRRSINEIIVQAKGETGFVHYKPSVIAAAAFAAATRIANGSQINEKLRSLGEVDIKCENELYDLCQRLRIAIEPQVGPAVATSVEVEDEEEEAQLIPRRRQDRGKAAMVLGPDVQEEEAQLQQIFEADAAERSIEEIVPEIETEQQTKAKAKGKAVAGSEEITTEEEIVPEIETEQQREAKGKGKAVASSEEIATKEEVVPEIETEQQREGKGKGKAVASSEEIATKEEVVPEIETEQQSEAKAKGKVVARSKEITTEEEIVPEIEREQQREAKTKGKAVARSEEITTEEEIVPEIETEQQREAKGQAVASSEESATKEEIVPLVETEQQREAKGKAIAVSEEITTEEEIVPEIETKQQGEAKDKAVARSEETTTEEEIVPLIDTEQQREAKGKAVASSDEIATKEEIVPLIETEQREAEAKGKAKGKAIADSEEEVSSLRAYRKKDLRNRLMLETAIKEGKARVVTRKTVAEMMELFHTPEMPEIVPVSELLPKTPMNFELKWPTDVVDIPDYDDVVAVEESQNVVSTQGNNQQTTNQTGGAVNVGVSTQGNNQQTANETGAVNVGCANCSII